MAALWAAQGLCSGVVQRTCAPHLQTLLARHVFPFPSSHPPTHPPTPMQVRHQPALNQLPQPAAAASAGAGGAGGRAGGPRAALWLPLWWPHVPRGGAWHARLRWRRPNFTPSTLFPARPAGHGAGHDGAQGVPHLQAARPRLFGAGKQGRCQLGLLVGRCRSCRWPARLPGSGTPKRYHCPRTPHSCRRFAARRPRSAPTPTPSLCPLLSPLRSPTSLRTRTMQTSSQRRWRRRWEGRQLQHPAGLLACWNAGEVCAVKARRMPRPGGPRAQPAPLRCPDAPPSGTRRDPVWRRRRRSGRSWQRCPACSTLTKMKT